MKRSHLLYIAGPAVLLLIAALSAVPAWAQQISLRSVSPNEGRAGEDLDLTIQGGGFCGSAQVTIGELRVGGVQVESDSAIRVHVSISADAQPGPRDVEVVVDCGPQETFSDVLPGGFTVLESPKEPPPGPSEPGPGEPEEPGPGEPGPPGPPPSGGWWPWLIVLIVVGMIALGGGAAAVTIAVKAHQAAQKKKWQQAAEEKLPEKCQSGYKVIRDKPKLKPGRWKVKELKVVFYDEARAQRGDEQREERDAPDELVRRIDGAARNELLWGDSEKLAAEVVEIGRALAAQVVAWQARSEVGRDVRLEPEIEGGEGSVKFTLYRCVGAPRWWQEVTSWKAQVQAVRHFQQEFRGPAAGEAPEAYRAVLEKGLCIYVYNLIREASRLWDTEGVGVSVQVSV
jgi:hypothetical protein